MTEEPIESIPGYIGLTAIGHGGSSVVYKARQQAFDRFVAVKVLRGDFDENSARRFLREAQLTGRLTGHPHVVTVLDAGTTRGGSPYLATDLYERGSLQDRLAGSGALPAAEVAAIGAKIAGALADAHALGIIHRDVKPNNILVSRFGEPALADFGVAVVPDTLSAVTMVNAFTPHHAAPEILNGAGASPLSDVYSLGSTLYHLLVGRPPFAEGGNDIGPLLYRIVNNPAPAVECPELPGLAAVIARALAKEPGERFADAGAMAEELRGLVPGGVPLGGEVAAVVALPPPVGSPMVTGPGPLEPVGGVPGGAEAFGAFGSGPAANRFNLPNIFLLGK